jgi:hypothetical protein
MSKILMGNYLLSLCGMSRIFNYSSIAQGHEKTSTEGYGELLEWCWWWLKNDLLFLLDMVKGLGYKVILPARGGWIFPRYQGGVAQLVRACGSYPQCPEFESLHRHHFYIQDPLRFTVGVLSFALLGIIER